ncbi:MAG: recombinase family protein [Candidatus Atribacteria bacterium]|nr:recombinase family protein [Candidatus Atribacteria bacterium]
MKLAVIYARCSTEEPAERGLSIASQLQSCREWCTKNDHSLIKEYIDEGHSGSTTKNRPAFMDMISDIENKLIKIDTVIVWSYSRFSRSRRDSIIYKSILKVNKAKLISISEPMPDDNMFSVLLESLIEAIWVRKIFIDYAHRKRLADIISELNQMGAKTKNGRDFCINSLYSILINPVYSGKLVWNRYAKSGSKLKDESESLKQGIYSVIAELFKIVYR